MAMVGTTLGMAVLVGMYIYTDITHNLHPASLALKNPKPQTLIPEDGAKKEAYTERFSFSPHFDIALRSGVRREEGSGDGGRG
jgi:hypothetical protein